MKLSTIAYYVAVMSTPFIASQTAIAALSSPTTNTATIAVEQNQNIKYAQLRQRWADYFLGNRDQVFDAGLSQVVSNINQQASDLLADMDITKTGLWADLELNNSSNNGRLQLGSNLYSTYNRLFVLARAYKLPGGELANDPQLRDILIESLTQLNERFYHVGAAEWGNWWHWQLGISRVSNNIMVMLYDDLPSNIIAQYVDASRYFVPRPTHLSEGYGAPYSSTPFMFESTGGNRTDNAQVVLIRGILDNNSAEISAAVKALSPVLPLVESGDGFYADGSFIQHKDLPYNGTYGQVMLEGLGMLLGLVANSEWHATDPALAQIYPILMRAYAPLLVDGQMMDFVNGRAVSRISGQNHQVGHSILSSMLLYVPGAPAEYKAQLESLIKTNVINDSYLDYFSNPKILSSYQLAQQIVRDKHIPMLANSTSHKQYPDMDRVVHKRPNWTFGVAMHSDRVGNYECINGENISGWHSADGMTYLYTNQLDHYSDFWPLVNPYQLPGTTSSQAPREACSGQLSSQRDGRNRNMDWTGGSQLGEFGISGMAFSSWNNKLSAKKSWFMLDNQVVALGAGIHNSDAAETLTTMENRKLTATAEVTVNGQPLTSAQPFSGLLSSMRIDYPKLNSNINYVLLTPQQGQVSQECKTGNWSAIGTDNKAVSGCFVSANLNHAKDHVSSYAYSLLPNLDGAAVQQYIAHPDVRILANNEVVQAIVNDRLGLIAANFWDKASISLVDDGTTAIDAHAINATVISAETPLSLMIDKSKTPWLIAVSDPTRAWRGAVTFTIPGNFTLTQDLDSRVESASDGSFNVDVSDLRGASYQFSVTPTTNNNEA